MIHFLLILLIYIFLWAVIGLFLHFLMRLWHHKPILSHIKYYRRCMLAGPFIVIIYFYWRFEERKERI